MQKNTFFFFTLLTSLSCFSQKYPLTKKIATTFTKHKISFRDDYSWLEDMKSEEVNNWVNAQNQATNLYCEDLNKTFNPTIVSVFTNYDSNTTYRTLAKKGKYYFTAIRNDNNTGSSLYLMESFETRPLEIVNPNLIYPGQKISITGHYASMESKALAYKISVDGAEREEMRFYNLETRKPYEDILRDIKYSKAAWNKDEGVFYNKSNNKELFAKDSTHQVFYHKLGNAQEQDRLVFDGAKNESLLSFATYKDRLILTEQNKTRTSKNYYTADLARPDFELVKFIENDTTDFRLLGYRNNRVYYSSPDFNWGEIRSFELKDIKKDSVTIPQIYNNLLDRSYLYDDYIVCKYKASGQNYLIVYDYSGKLIRRVDAPLGTDVEIMDFDDKTKELYYGFFSSVLPYQNYKLNVETGDDQPFYSRVGKAKPTLFPLDYFQTETTNYKSRDGEDIPITIVYKKVLKRDGNNPTLLKAYGAFGAVNSSYYDIGLVYFLEKGGVYAYAGIRGGGEKGLKWHKDGMGLKKNNTFSDFIDAAEFLIRERYTSANRLGITGTSQGGLLVDIAMTQRPELFKVVISSVGPSDMIQYGKYTVGESHYDEYGNPEKEAEYKSLLGYSPYHNIKEEVNYPTTLLITSDNDGVVPPFHSYKFAARLQNRPAQKNPIYLKTLRKAGHSGITWGYKDYLNEKAEFYSFLLYHLNL